MNYILGNIRLLKIKSFRYKKFRNMSSFKSSFKVSAQAQKYIDLEEKYGAHNYDPLPIVIKRAKNIHVWDVDGKKYIDCLSAYSAINQGHCNKAIRDAMKQQIQSLTLTSRAFYNGSLNTHSQFLKLR